jgi:heme-degrading monooxygenase HmoA
VVESEPEKQAEALSVMTERARFMARQPGFVSIGVHRSNDGRRIVNYIQWESREQPQAAHTYVQQFSAHTRVTTTGVHLSPAPPCRFAHSLQVLCCAWAGRHPPVQLATFAAPIASCTARLADRAGMGTAARPPEPEEAIV